MIINLHLPLLLDSTDVDVEKDADVEKAPPHRNETFCTRFLLLLLSLKRYSEEMLPESLVDFVVLHFQQNLQHCWN